jgi:arginase family enzyme
VTPAALIGAPSTLGGDCTVGVGTVAGALAAGGAPPGLVYFDMHADLNTPETVETGTLDWMGMAHMLGLPGTVPELAAALQRALSFAASRPSGAPQSSIDAGAGIP